MASAPEPVMNSIDTLTIAGGRVTGDISVPGDKSISHRVAMFAALADGRSSIRGFLRSEDCLATLNALTQLGVHVEWQREVLIIDGQGLSGFSQPENPIDCGNSGTTMRLLCGLLSGQDFPSVLTGDASLMRRPMERVAEPLRRMGVAITTTDGCAPVRIDGSPNVAAAETDIPLASAQVKTALTLAALYAHGTSRIAAPGLVRDHTERLLPLFGVAVKRDQIQTWITGPATLTAVDFTVPGDFSSAAFFMVAACIAGVDTLVIRNVGLNPGRIALLNLLRAMGARIETDNIREDGPEPIGDITVWPSRLSGIQVPEHQVAAAIDEFPALCVAAACADGITEIEGADELRHKESDRIQTMADALHGLGVSVKTSASGIKIEGGPVSGGTVDSAGDHRIAMASSLLGLVSGDPVTVRDTQCIQTSFPGFTELLGAVGVTVTRQSTGPVPDDHKSGYSG